jgi:hypothetical protein
MKDWHKEPLSPKTARKMAEVGIKVCFSNGRALLASQFLTFEKYCLVPISTIFRRNESFSLFQTPRFWRPSTFSVPFSSVCASSFVLCFHRSCPSSFVQSTKTKRRTSGFQKGNLHCRTYAPLFAKFTAVACLVCTITETIALIFVSHVQL